MWEAAGNFLNGPVRIVYVYGTLGLQGQFDTKKNPESLSEFDS